MAAKYVASNCSQGITGQASYVQRNSEARSHNHYCRGKVISITYSECVFVGLVTQHDKRMRFIMSSSVGCLAPPYFSTYFHKGHDFLGEKNC